MRALPAWRLRRVIEYVEAHLDEDLTLAELAGVAGFSVSHFKPLFKTRRRACRCTASFSSDASSARACA